MTNIRFEEALDCLGLTLRLDLSKDDIVHAYKKACSKYHPDKPNGDKDMMSKVNVSYDWLTKNFYQEFANWRQSVLNPPQEEPPVVWSSFSDKPSRPNVQKNAVNQIRPATRYSEKNPYKYPDNIPKWNVNSTLNNDWETLKYERKGDELDEFIGSRFSPDYLLKKQAASKDKKK